MSNLREDVAIIGMACIFPGARDLQLYWENIISKVDTVSDPPGDWEGELSYDQDSWDNNEVYCRRGGYLKELATFDPFKYGVMPSSVNGGEPDHFLALRVAYDALADAGYLDRLVNRERVEVIVGRGTYTNRGNSNWLQHGFFVEQTLRILKQVHPEHTPEELRGIGRKLKASLPPFNAEMAPGLFPNILSGRIANRLDLMGPSYTVDAACASSLIAVELGMQDLLARKCDLAIVGGVHASTPPPIHMIFCKLNALSRRGQIRPFDKKADGTLLAEGVGLIVLKRREDAEQDGDRIYALIKGIGTASDGRALGLLAPRVEGEELALRRAYGSTEISPHTVELIEAHGTGTPVGDATEIQALSRAFGPCEKAQPRCAIGSVKSMIGHPIPAAGIAGLIKTALALYHKVLPPTLHCEEPNPKLELEKTAFYINTETRPWIHGGLTPRRAGVNAFGFGGINAHAILEEYTVQNEGGLPSLLHHWDSEVFILRGDSREDVVRQGEILLRLLSSTPAIEPKDLAYTLNCPLPESGYRLAIVAESLHDLEKKLVFGLQRLADPGCTQIKDRSGIFFTEDPLSREGTLAFLFPGEGSQYVNMLSDLCLHFPEVRVWFDLADRIFLDRKRDLLPSQILFPPPLARSAAHGPPEHELWRMDIAVCSVFTADHALFRLLGRLEIRPQALVGHSSGEFTTLVASGAVEVRDEAQLFAHGLDLLGLYGTLTEQVPLGRLMAVGAADPAVVASVVSESGGGLYLTMDNCPHQGIVCGTDAALAAALDRFQSRGAICNLLPFDRAYHTPLFTPACDHLAPFYDRLKLVPPHTTMYSCATARPYSRDPGEIRRLALEQWARPVRFRETIEAMHDAGVRIFVEVGPRGNLTGFVDDILRNRRYLAVPSNVHHRSGITQLNHLIGLLAAHGVPIRLDYLYARRQPRRLLLEPAEDRSVSSRKETGEKRLALELPKLGLGGGPSKDFGVLPSLPRISSSQRPAPHHNTLALENPPQPSGIVSQAPKGSNNPVHRATDSPVMSGTPSSTGKYTPHFHHQKSIRCQVMQEYLRTMDQFLEAQRQATAAFLTEGSSRVLLAQQRQRHRPPSLKDTLQHRGSPASTGPFRITISSLHPGKEVTATCQLDLHEDLFLLDHTLGKHPSDLDESLTALPVVPLTISLEIMAQVAAFLVSDEILIGMKGVRAHRWIEVEQQRLTLLLSAKPRSSDRPKEIEVKILEGVRTESTTRGNGGLLVEGTMIFGTEYPMPPQRDLSPLRMEAPYRFRPDQYYREVLFHQALFQAVTSIDRSGEDGVEATLRVLPRTGLFRSHTDPQFLTDPVLLDAAGQAAGFWMMARPESGFVAFPVGFEALHFYGPWPQVSERIKCHARIALLADGRVHSDIGLVDSEARLLLRLDGWKTMRFFDWTRKFVRLTLLPRDTILSDRWSSPAAHLPPSLGLRCCRLSDNGAGIWPRVLAYIALNRQEREVWFQLNGPERRRNEWLRGRLAAKDAVRLFLKDRYQLEYCPADIEIVTNEHGQPGVGKELLKKLGRSISLSIAHAGGIAVAIAGDAGEYRGVGIDVEPIGRRQEGLEQAALSMEESALLAELSPGRREEWLLRLWCAKEAVSKALGRGMVAGPHNLVVRNLHVESGRVTMGLVGELASELPAFAGTIFTAYTGMEDNFVFASALA